MADSLTLDYRQLIVEELQKRRSKNPSYSMRAFSKHLGLSSGNLSDLINGGKDLSDNKAYAIARKLKWKSGKIELFLLLLRYSRCKDAESRQELEQEIAQKRSIDLRYRKLASDEFILISEWYYGAILELSKIADFQMTPQSIATRLPISEAQAALALERLVKMNLLTQNKEGLYQPAETQVIMPDQHTRTLAVSKYHAEILRLAATAVNRQAPSERHFTGVTLAVSPSQISEAKKRIERFREEMTIFLEKTPKPESLYHLSLQFFSLEKK